MRRSTLTAFSIAALVFRAPPLVAQQAAPADWKWVLDGSGRPATPDVRDSSWTFVAMPPGWHLTTGPGAFVFHPAYDGRGQFSVEAEAFLFPGRSSAGWGIFFGGSDLTRPDNRTYSAVLVRHDGAVSVVSQRGADVTTHRAWAPDTAVRVQRGDSTARNAVRADIGRDSITVRINGARVAAFDRAALPVEGALGFRVGGDVNLHAIRLDVTYRLAPLPAKR
jgi:hypothetical protein